MSSLKTATESLKAIIFADSFYQKSDSNLAFGKPLLNTSILNWQLAALARSGAKEAIVLSSEPLTEIETDPLQQLKVRNISSPTWNCEGDALRDIERRSDLCPTDDFVLIASGSVFNLDIAKMLKEHKARRKADRNWLISTVFRRGAGSADKQLVIAVESRTNTLVNYFSNCTTSISINVMEHNSALQNGSQVEIVSNVLDCGIDICSPEFLLEFRENFYYDQVRSYIKEKLDGDGDVFGNRMHAYFVDSSSKEYAARVTCLASLAQTTLDVLNGWMKPFEEEMFNENVREGMSHLYRTAYVVENSAIGENVTIDMGCTIIDSVIGNNVKIGSDVTILRSIVMDGAEVLDRSYIRRSIVEQDCIIRVDTIIPNNCFFKRGLSVGPACNSMQSYSYFTREDDETERQESHESSDEEASNDAAGNVPEQKETNKSLSPKDDANESSDEKLNNLITLSEEWSDNDVSNICSGRLVEYSYAVSVDPFFIEHRKVLDYESDGKDDLEEEDVDDDTVDEIGGSDTLGKDQNGGIEIMSSGMQSIDLNKSAVEEATESRNEMFSEVFETINRAFTENIEVENTTLEINSLKLAYQSSFPETLAGIMAGIAKSLQSHNKSSVVPYDRIVSSLKDYTTLITLFKAEDIAHNAEATRHMAWALREDGTLLMHLLHAMVKMDFLEADGILKWAAEERKQLDDGIVDGNLLQTMGEFLKWLEEEESDEDEDESDGHEEDKEENG